MTKQHHLRIALLSYRSNPYSGGQGVYIKFLSKALVELGHEVHVFSGEPYPELSKQVKLIPVPGLNFYGYQQAREAIRARGIHNWTDLIEFFSYITGGFPEPLTFGQRLLTKYGTCLQQYDLIHDNQSLCPALLKLQNKGLPLVSTVHHPITKDLQLALSHEPDWGMRLLIKRWHYFLKMQKRVARRLKRIITVSRASKADIAKDFALAEDRVDVVYNGVELDTFHPCPDIAKTPLSIFATASADVPLKGLTYLLQALHLLKQEFPSIKLTVLGKPKPNGPTQKLVTELGLEPDVKFISGITTREIVREYAKCTLAVIPSLYEGFGFPAVEAMACRVPVVSTTGGSLAEVVGDAGILVPPKDPAAMSQAIKQILHHPELAEKLAEKGLARVKDKFTWTRTAQQMTLVYQRVIQKQTRQLGPQESTDAASVPSLQGADSR